MNHIDQLLEKQKVFGRAANAGTDEHHVEGAGFQRVADRRARRAGGADKANPGINTLIGESGLVSGYRATQFFCRQAGGLAVVHHILVQPDQDGGPFFAFIVIPFSRIAKGFPGAATRLGKG